MTRPDGIRATRSLVIPHAEIDLKFTPSGGPGGQHANRSSTRVELSWNVASSPSLGPRQRDRIREHLGKRIDSSGVLRLTSDRYRSQLRNREDAENRLARLVAAALTPRKKRIGTKPSAAATERRIRAKKHRSETKRRRRALDDYG